MFTIGGMKFYGNPETDNMVWSYPADGSDDSIIPAHYFVLDEAGYNAIRAVQIAEAAPTEEQLLNAARVERDALLATAGLRISPLQDAVDLEVATDIDKASLKLWKQYRVAVNRVPDQTGYPAVIEWPTVPD